VVVPAPSDLRFAHLSWPKIVTTRDGALVLAYSAGRFHGNDGGGSPAVSVSTDRGRTFTAPQVLQEFGPGMKYTACGNLALGIAPDGAVVLLAMAFTGDRWNTVVGWRSADAGTTWQRVDTSTLEDSKTGSVFGHVFPVPGKGLAATGHYRAGSKPYTNGIWIAYSADEGRTWGVPRRITDRALFEPAILFTEGRFIGLIREKAGRQYWELTSNDRGATWNLVPADVGKGGSQLYSFPSPFIASDPSNPKVLYALESNRSRSADRPGRIVLWRGEIDSRNWKPLGTVVQLERDADHTDFTYPWMTPLGDGSWFVVFYSGKGRGANSIYGLALRPDQPLFQSRLGDGNPPAAAAGASIPAPAGLSGKAGSPSHIDLKWTPLAVGGETVQIERRDITHPTNAVWIELGAVPGTRGRFQSVGLEEKHTYAHRLRTVAGTQSSDWIQVDPITTPGTGTEDRGRVLIAGAPPFPRNGEGDLLLLRNGELVYIYGQWPGSGDFAAETRIGMMRSPDQGATWSKPSTLFYEPGHDLYHASLVRMNNGEIGLTYTHRIRQRIDGKSIMKGEKVFRYSRDECQTWSDEILISDGSWQYYQTSANDRLTLLENGRLVHPVSRSFVPDNPEKQISTLVYTSDDQGRTWQRRTPKPLEVGDPAGIPYFHEARIIEHAPGQLLMYGRTRTGWLWESRSTDHGDSWTAPQRSTVRGPVSPMMMENIPGQPGILLIWNPLVAVRGTLAGDRKILASQISEDGGRTWDHYRQIEYRSPKAGHYCYTSCTWIGETLHLTYFGMHGSRVMYRSLPKNWFFDPSEP